MPLHSTGLTSRHALIHPEESVPQETPTFDRVLKWNESQHPRDKSGQFSSGGPGGISDALNAAEDRAKKPYDRFSGMYEGEEARQAAAKAKPPYDRFSGMYEGEEARQRAAREKIRQSAEAHLKGMSVDIASPEYRGVATPAHLRGMRVDVASPDYRGVGHSHPSSKSKGISKQVGKASQATHTGSMHSSGRPTRRSSYS